MSARPEEQMEMLEAGFSSDELLPAPRSARLMTPKRILALAAGAFGLAGCAYVVTRSGGSAAPAAPEDGHITARELLEHPEFLDAASDNLLTLGRGLLDDKADKLRPSAAIVMKKVSEMMEVHDPEGARYLSSVKLSPHQRSSVVSVVKKMSDKQVQNVGREVLQIAYERKGEKDGFKTAAEKLKETFSPRMNELQELKNKAIPASFQEEIQKKYQTLNTQETPKAEAPRKLATCTGDTSTCNPGSELTSSMGKGMSLKLEDALGIVGGLLEQARLALDASATIGSSFGSQTHVPWFVRSLIGGAAYATEVTDCFMRQDDQHSVVNGHEVLTNANSGDANTVKMEMCPMKYAGAAMDMLSGVNNAAGIQNSNLPSDFQMMFGGTPQAGYNAYQHPQQQQFANPFAAFFQPVATTTLHPMIQQMQQHMQNANAMSNMANMLHQHMQAAAGQTAATQTSPFAYNNR